MRKLLTINNIALFLMSFLFLGLSNIYSIDSDKKINSALLKKANSYYKIDEFENALPIFLDYDSKSPNNLEVNYKIGVCYLNSSQKTQSLPYFRKAKNVGINIDPSKNYNIARSYHLSNKFDTAIVYYDLYKSSLKTNQKVGKEDLIIVDQQITACKSGLEFAKKPIRLKIQNLGPNINTVDPEYSPVITADENEIIFTSRRANTTGGQKDKTDDKYMEDLYLSIKNADSTWQPAIQMSQNVNSDSHDGSVAISGDGSELIVYRGVGKKDGDLFISEYKDGKWLEAKRLSDSINTNYREASACMSLDGKTLIFSSDKPGGFGGLDLYKSIKNKNGVWSNAVNLGSKINTSQNEDAPFLHMDGKTMYFSSQGHNSIGGYDVFTTTFDYQNDTMTHPINIGFPINTAEDEIYFVWSADGSKAYFSSQRFDSYGDKDIYRMDLGVAVIDIFAYNGAVYYNGDSLQKLSSVVKVLDLITKDTIGIFYTNPQNGLVTLSLPTGKKYDIIVESIGYMPHHEIIEVLKPVHDFSSYHQAMEVKMKQDSLYNSNLALLNNTIKSDSLNGNTNNNSNLNGTSINKNNSNIISSNRKNTISGSDNSVISKNKNFYVQKIEAGNKIDLPNLYFDYDKFDIKSESETQLQVLVKMLNDNPSVKIEIHGHTDNIGSKKYNKVLSQKRANSVVKYLVDKGIAKNRLTSKAMGIAKDPNETEDQRSKNRRTEFLILGDKTKVSKKIVIKEDSENEKFVTKDSPKYNKLVETISDKDIQDQVENYIPSSDVSTGRILGPKVHFCYNDSKVITDYSKIRLERLVKIMNLNPTIKVKIIGYADKVGNDNFNQNLSKARAERVKKYLTQKGIDSKRLKLTFDGENNPVINTEERKVNNRRVEFEIVK